MKKGIFPILILTFVFVLGASHGAFAQGGFVGPSQSSTTVAKALTLRDDSYVTLTGNIVERQGKDKYLFKDSTGTIYADIEDHKWSGLTVTPENTVEIQGEIDKDWNSVEVDVHTLKIVR
jgi:uncharacterized protein (TIGR00156 family)